MKHNTKLPHFSTLDKDFDCDVSIVGGGITSPIITTDCSSGISGLTSAYLLSLKGKSVVVVEDGEICSGETGRTSAHLASGVDDRYFNLASNFGKEGKK